MKSVLDHLLDQVIEEATLGARHAYSAVEHRPKLTGALQGLAECQGKSPPEIAALLTRATQDRLQATDPAARDHWMLRAREAEIAWVADVLSAAMLRLGQPGLLEPSARGSVCAARLLGQKPTLA